MSDPNSTTSPETHKQKKHHSKKTKSSSPSLIEDSSPSPATPHKKRSKKRVELKSPETDLVSHSKIASLASLGNLTDTVDDSIIDLCSQAPANYQKDTDIVFIPDGSGYRYKPTDISQTRTIEVEIINDPSKDSLEFKKSFEMTQRSVLTIIDSLYAGSCILSLLLLPSDASKFSQFSAAPKIYEKGLRNPNANLYAFYFVAYYSGYALNVSFLFQILSTLTLFLRLDSIYQYYEVCSLKVLNLGRTKLKAATASVALLCSVVSFVATVLMIHIDHNLNVSQYDAKFGGAFGKPNWFYKPDLLHSDLALSYFKNWTEFQLLRAIFGILSFFLARASQIESDNLASMKKSYSNLVHPQ